MKNFAIIRTEKIKDKDHFKRRIKHDFRIDKVMNADLSIQNEKFGFTPKMALKKWNENFAAGGKFEKRRKDAVLFIDYIITASPDFFENNSKKTEQDFFKESIEFIEQKHGKNNIAYYVQHNDETTPHMHIIVVPEAPDGKLKCTHFLDGRKKCRQLQDDFYKKVKHFGLQRGEKAIEGINRDELKKAYIDIKKTAKAIDEKDPNRYKYNEPNKLGFLSPAANKENKETIEELHNYAVARHSQNIELNKENTNLKKDIYNEKNRTTTDRRIEQLRTINIEQSERIRELRINNDEKARKFDNKLTNDKSNISNRIEFIQRLFKQFNSATSRVYEAIEYYRQERRKDHKKQRKTQRERENINRSASRVY